MHLPYSMRCMAMLTCRGSTNKVGASTDGVTGEAGDGARCPETIYTVCPRSSDPMVPILDGNSLHVAHA